MARLVLFMVCSGILFVNCIGSQNIIENSDITVDGNGQLEDKIIRENLIDSIQTLPNYDLYQSHNSKIRPRIQATSLSTNKTIIYKLGKRVIGDRLLAWTSSNFQWTVTHNVNQTFTYPRNGVGAYVTYVEIIVDQNSSLRRGFTTSGGIGQRQITITILGEKTQYFRLNAYIYGY